MRRFYKNVSSGERDGEVAVFLDDSIILTPAKIPLLLPTSDLANAVAAEWREQDGHIRPEVMPLTRLAISAKDIVSPARETFISKLARYGSTDLLCYRSCEEELAFQQEKEWQPLLNWAARDLGVCLSVVVGVMPIAQEPHSLCLLRDILREYSDMELSALSMISSISGSLILAMAVSKGRLTGRNAWDLGRIEEEWQTTNWGEDAEALKRAEEIHLDFMASVRFLTLCNAD